MLARMIDGTAGGTLFAWMRVVAGVCVMVKTPWIVEYGAVVAGVAWFLAGAAMASGWAPRAGGLAVGAVAIWVFGFSDYYRHHVYFLVLLAVLLVLADTGHAVSVRARRWTTAERVPAWPGLLLGAHVSVMYLFTAISKTRPEFLSGSVIDEAMTQSIFLPAIDLPSAVLVPMSVGILASEYFLAVGLWLRRTWPAAVIVGAVLHGTILVGVSNHPLGFVDLVVFTVSVFVVYPVYRITDAEPVRLTRHRIGTPA